MAFFILIHAFVRFVQLKIQIRLFPPGNTCGDADAMFFRVVAYASDSVEKGLFVFFSVDDKKFIPADTEGCSLEQPSDAVGCAPDESVAGLVTVPVVDEFQTVEVKTGQPQATAGEFIAQQIELGSVVKSGQCVLETQAFQQSVLPVCSSAFPEALSVLLPFQAGTRAIPSSFFQESPRRCPPFPNRGSRYGCGSTSANRIPNGRWS